MGGATQAHTGNIVQQAMRSGRRLGPPLTLPSAYLAYMGTWSAFGRFPAAFLRPSGKPL